jgi:chromosome segregation ATPase
MTAGLTWTMPNMTIDQLGALIQQEFHGVYGRLDGIEQRLGRLEQRMEGLEQRMDALEQRVDALEQRMDTLEQRVDHLEIQMAEGFAELRDMIRGFAYAKEIDDLRGRVTNIEKKIGM